MEAGGIEPPSERPDQGFLTCPHMFKFAQFLEITGSGRAWSDPELSVELTRFEHAA